MRKVTVSVSKATKINKTTLGLEQLTSCYVQWGILINWSSRQLCQCMFGQQCVVVSWLSSVHAPATPLRLVIVFAAILRVVSRQCVSLQPVQCNRCRFPLISSYLSFRLNYITAVFYFRKSKFYIYIYLFQSIFLMLY